MESPSAHDRTQTPHIAGDEERGREDRPSGTHRVAHQCRTRQATQAECGEVGAEFPSLIGVSEAMTRLREQLKEAGDSTSPILLLGERGVGKRHVARAMHEANRSSEGVLFSVSSASSVQDVLGVELPRLAALAHRGAVSASNPFRPVTVLIEEIQALPLSVQGTIVQSLASGFQTLTAGCSLRIRVVATSSANLERVVDEGRFLPELYQALWPFSVRIAPLRERKGDIQLLAQRFVALARERAAKPDLTSISVAALAALAQRDWPGNVAELRDVIDGAVSSCRGQLLGALDIGGEADEAASDSAGATQLPLTGIDLRSAVEEFENHLIRQALERTRWNKNQAAKLLGLNRTTLVEMLKRKGIRAA